jgi:hypothetical protein
MGMNTGITGTSAQRNFCPDRKEHWEKRGRSGGSCFVKRDQGEAGEK